MGDSGHIFNSLYNNPAIVILPNGKFVVFYANVLKQVAYDVNFAKESVFLNGTPISPVYSLNSDDIITAFSFSSESFLYSRINMDDIYKVIELLRSMRKGED